MNDISKILSLDYQQIYNKLLPLCENQISTDSIVLDGYDENTKTFLSFIVKIIETSKDIYKTSTENTVKKIEQLVKDSNKIIVDYFNKNSLISYYDSILKEALSSINESLKSTSKSFNVESIKSMIVDILNIFNERVKNEIEKQYDAMVSDLKEDLSDLVAIEIEKSVSTTLIEQAKTTDTIKNAIDSSLKMLMQDSIPNYVKTLNEKFNENFAIYQKKSFLSKINPKQSLIKIADRISKPFVDLKKKISYNINETKQKVLTIVEPFRKPVELMKNLFKKKDKKKAKPDSAIEVFKKYGLLAAMVVMVANAIHRRKKSFQLLGQMDFKPFKFMSIATNTVDDFIDSIAEHVWIIKNNLAIYLDKNEVESYGEKSKDGSLFSRLKKKISKVKPATEGLGLFGFLASLPRLFKLGIQIFNFIRKIPQFFRNLKSILSTGIRLLKTAVRKLGEKLSMVFGKQVAKKIEKKTIKSLEQKTAKQIEKKVTKQTEKQFLKTAEKQGTKAVAKTALKVAGIVASFAVDGFFAYKEAQDNDRMAKLFGIADPSLVGTQQRTAYTIAGTLAGNESLLDADWSNPMDVGMAALGTAMTIGKYAAIGSFFAPPIGTAIGAGIGAVIALVGTERLAIGINAICERAKKAWGWIKDVSISIWDGVKKSLNVAWSAYTYINPLLLITVHGKEIWDWTTKTCEKLWNKTKELASRISSFYSRIKDKFVSKLKGLKSFVDDKIAIINSSVTAATESFKQKLTPAYDFAKTTLDAAKSTINKTKDIVKNSIVGKAARKTFNFIKISFDDKKADIELNQKLLDAIERKTEELDLKETRMTSLVDKFKELKNKKLVKENNSLLPKKENINKDSIEDIFDLFKLSSFADQLFAMPPELVPIPVEGPSKNIDSPATSAANHWA